MTTLVLQTVLPRVELLLLDQKGRVLAGANWISNKDEIRKIPPQLEKLLKDCGLNWSKIARIVSVVGVGNFSATRIGVTIANILAMAIESEGGGKVELFELKLAPGTETNQDPGKLAGLVKTTLRTGLAPVKLAKPVYASEPMISPSKKKVF